MSDRARPVLVVANRLPVSKSPQGWVPSAGGLVTALRPVVEDGGGAWIGWDDDHEGVPAQVDGLACTLRGLRLSGAEVQGYYHGFANRTLWPLLHDLVVTPIIEARWWAVYRDVNERFAQAVDDELDADDEQTMVWVHDYHLMLVPAMLRRRRPRTRIGFFLHVPFPPPELFARLPWRGALLDGLLAADAIGVHTERYRDNLLRTIAHLVADVEVVGDRIRTADGHEVEIVVGPISIDATGFAALATDPETEAELQDLRTQFGDRRVLLGVDRLDYTKGIPNRLEAIEQLLTEHPEHVGRIAFVQIAVPSRDDVREYRELRQQVETEVGRINGRFTHPGSDVPVHYLYRGISRPALAAYYRLADVMCVTPLKDGMNLVAKEFVTVQHAADAGGVLLLSEFCGAALELGGDAVRCNPFDVNGMSTMMDHALALPPADRRERLARMARRIHDHDVFAWVDGQLEALRGRR
ncbi:MAG: trehalose-6-phosphate synthase [Nitriliruptoraceae bacterium]|nr:trehalose-6-phosphate synthase [Nitriliruptoraceae bacterium]